MTARISPEPVSPVLTPAVDYRPRPAGTGVPSVADAALAESSFRSAPNRPVRTGETAADAVEVATSYAEAPPPLPEPPAPGTTFVMAVISGALSPRPTSLEEVFLRTGTGWVPPDSQYRLADKKA